MRIYLDFDDVLAESFKALSEFAFASFGKSPAPGKQTHFDLHISLGLDETQYDAFMDEFHATKLLDIDEIPGACETLRGWLSDGIEPVVVTGRPFSAHDDSVRWLEERGVSPVQVLHVDKYGRFHDDSASPVVQFDDLRSYGFGLAVDDAPAALDALSRARMCPFVVFERPWNLGWSPPAGGATPLEKTGDWRRIDEIARSLCRRTRP